ncbi:hypothetical protein M885DRAFT_505821 [Pelagophyceae sp. CCMP2097]|nr:hypothetical protein M885DRAFT_505821 [Pelagophyceae sp. CCMP2097]|mmetsp:Transcript_22798/g.77107  ORF Transcript_22798/g.77107 Transcript_22798/m.77107 type:complete len:228 (+) Transcript_22798:53-736(+)
MPMSSRAAVVSVLLVACCDGLVSLSRPAAPRGGLATRPRLVPAEVWADYLGALEAQPLLTKACTAGVIIGAGDATAQVVESLSAGAATFDAKRAARWATFGFALQAPWNHFYYQLLDGALPPTVDPFTATTAVKVLIDQGIQAPIFTAVIFVFFALVEGRGIAAAGDQIQKELGQVLVKNWAVFIPATAINLAFCPPELRVLFLNAVFFFWVIYLSLTVNASAQKTS